MRSREARRLGFTAPVCAAFALIFAVGCADATPRGEILVLDRATLQLSGEDVAQDVELPHRFPLVERESTLAGTYTLPFTLDRVTDEPWAIYVANHRMNVVVTLNGVFVGDCGSTSEPVARNWNRPVLFRLPRGVLREGENRIDIELYASPTSVPRLSLVRVGTHRELFPLYDRAVLRHITVRQISVAFLWLIALATTILASRGAAPRSSLWLAATAALIGFAQLDGFVRHIPVSTLMWQVTNTAAYFAGIVCFVISVHRLVELRAPRFESSLAIAAAVLAIGSAFIDPAYFATATVGMLSLTALILTYVLWRAYRAGSGSTQRGILALSVVLLVIGAIDAAHSLFGLGGAAPRATGFVPVVVAAFTGWMLLEMLRQILDRNDLLNEELDRRIATRERDLARSHEHLQSMERSVSLADERGRLVREMHDGLGSLLVSTLALVEGGERNASVIADALREVLDEMRLMLDSLEPDEDDLAALLGRVRARLAPRLVRAGLRVDWHVPVDAALPPLEPRTLHHVMRIVQEAVGNVIRHADASMLSIRTRLEDEPDAPEIVIEISDDGRGLPESARNSHRGLAHLKNRAKEIDGRLEIVSSRAGTSIRVRFPVEQLQTPAQSA